MYRDRIILDLEPYLCLIEDICHNHKSVFFKDLLFVKNKRFPLEYRWESGKYPDSWISDKPYLSIVSAPLVRDLIKFCIIDDPKIHDMMKSNPLENDKVKTSFIPCFKDEYSIIYNYLDSKPSDEEVDEIIDVTGQIVEYVSRYVDSERILDIDIESQYFEITMKENIAYLRMKEAGYA